MGGLDALLVCCCAKRPQMKQELQVAPTFARIEKEGEDHELGRPRIDHAPRCEFLHRNISEFFSRNWGWTPLAVCKEQKQSEGDVD